MSQTFYRQDLEARLRRIHGKSYGAYRQITGTYDFGDFAIKLDRIQRDPFAPPTMVQVEVDFGTAGFDPSDQSNKSRAIALCDFVARKVSRVLDGSPERVSGSGNSGRIEIARPGQEILERTSVYLADSRLCCRLYVGLPANGRRINASAAITLLCEVLPGVVRGCLFADPGDADALAAHADANEDQDALREMLAERKWVAFVANAAILPRAAGHDDRPLTDQNVTPFSSPTTLCHDVQLPRAGVVSGMGIPEGVTLIVGGGYHGKSTLLQAIAQGVYNHIPGDGREHVVTRADAVKVRAEEGRSVSRVDLRPYIDGLPGGLEAGCFSTQNASGSTSQAASVAEYLSAGTTAFLIDEDSSASNFLSRDARMVALVPDSEEPIRPFVRFVKRLSETGVSTIMAMGGSSAYFGAADLVLRLRDYGVADVTAEARLSDSVSDNSASVRPIDLVPRFPMGTRSPGVDLGRVKVKDRALLYGKSRLDLTALEQVRDSGQIEGIAQVIKCCAAYFGEGVPIGQLVHRVMETVEESGLGSVVSSSGRCAVPRRIDVIAALNRARFLDWGP